MARRFAGRSAVIITCIATYMVCCTRCFAGSGGKLQNRYLPRTAAALAAGRRTMDGLADDPSPEQQQRALLQVEKALRQREGGSTKLASNENGMLGIWDFTYPIMR
eukprot:4844186-Amphidinium_carterae.2